MIGHYYGAHVSFHTLYFSMLYCHAIATSRIKLEASKQSAIAALMWLPFLISFMPLEHAAYRHILFHGLFEIVRWYFRK